MKEMFIKEASSLGVEIDHMKLLKENKSHNTLENLIFSRTLLAERFVTKVILITSDFHMKRAKVLSELVFPRSRYQIQTSEDHPILSEREKDYEDFLERSAAEHMQLLIQNYSHMIDNGRM